MGSRKAAAAAETESKTDATVLDWNPAKAYIITFTSTFMETKK